MTAPSATLTDERPLALPGRPGPTLERIWGGLTEDARKVLLEMLLDPHTYNGEWLAHVLSDESETSISATTIKTYRRALAREGELV